MCTQTLSIIALVSTPQCLPIDVIVYNYIKQFLVGKMIHSMVAHLDAVTSLAVDPSGLYLLSGSKSSFFLLSINRLKSLFLILTSGFFIVIYYVQYG